MKSKQPGIVKKLQFQKKAPPGELPIKKFLLPFSPCNPIMPGSPRGPSNPLGPSTPSVPIKLLKIIVKLTVN